MTEDDILLAHRLADAAGSAIRRWFRAPFSIEYKEDASPVTLADREAEAAIRSILDRERPDDGIIGEEYGTVREEAERQWVLDPIDGTRSFIAGRPIFGTLIALLEAGRPVLGVVDQPIARERWLGAAGHGTRFNDRPAKVRPCAELSRVLLGSTSPGCFSASDLPRFDRLAISTHHTLWGGDCYNYGLLASGHLDLVVEAGLKLHDFAALVPVVEGAGGRFCDWQGEPVHAASDGRVIALGDARLLEPVLAALA